MENLEANKKDLKVAKKEFKKLRKSALIEIIIQLQELVLGYKAKIAELERMFDERGLVIEALKENLTDCKKNQELLYKEKIQKIDIPLQQEGLFKKL